MHVRNSHVPKETLELTADLTNIEIAEELARLRFQEHKRRLVAIDKDVRDFLRHAIRPR